jgi:hypothetical protein
LEYETALTDDDVGKLLDFIGGIDGHDHGSAADALLWSMAAKAGRWTRAETVAGVMALMREFRGFMVKPGDMERVVDDARTAVRAGWNPPPPPRELGDDPKAEIEWRRAALADYRERAIFALAQGEPLASVPMLAPHFVGRPELPAAPPGGAAELEARAELQRAERRMGVPALPAARSVRWSPTVPRVLDPMRLDEIRREVAERAPVPLPGDFVDAERTGVEPA